MGKENWTLYMLPEVVFKSPTSYLILSRLSLYALDLGAIIYALTEDSVPGNMTDKFMALPSSRLLRNLFAQLRYSSWWTYLTPHQVRFSDSDNNYQIIHLFRI